MRTPERIAADRLRAGARTGAGPAEAGYGGVAETVHDQVLDCSGAIPAAKTAFRFGQSGTVRGLGHGVFRRNGAF